MSILNTFTHEYICFLLCDMNKKNEINDLVYTSERAKLPRDDWVDE